MTRVIIVGDGPGGLSAALFLAKNDVETVVFGMDATAMHHAYLHNYLGAPDVAGSVFQERAITQAAGAGASIRRETVSTVKADAQGVSVQMETGESLEADYLVLSEGKNPALARALGLQEGESGGIAVDAEGRSSNSRTYVVGRSARPSRSQAIISAGDGAKAALDILAREAGKDVQDWDTPPKQ